MYVINLDDKNSKGTHCFSLFIDRSNVSYFDSFEIEYISLEVLIKMREKSVTQLINLLWILSYRFHRI